MITKQNLNSKEQIRYYLILPQLVLGFQLLSFYLLNWLDVSQLHYLLFFPFMLFQLLLVSSPLFLGLGYLIELHGLKIWNEKYAIRKLFLFSSTSIYTFLGILIYPKQLSQNGFEIMNFFMIGVLGYMFFASVFLLFGIIVDLIVLFRCKK